MNRIFGKRPLGGTVALTASGMLAWSCALWSCSLGLPSSSDYFPSPSSPSEGGTSSAGPDATTPVEASIMEAATDGPQDASDASDARDAGVVTTSEAGSPDATAVDASSDAPLDSPDSGADAAAAPPAVLQIYYSFDEDGDGGAGDGGTGDGGTGDGGGADAGAPVALDSSGHHLDATLQGMVPPSFVPQGHLNQGLLLDGTQKQYVVLPPGVVSTFDSMSVSCWIKLTVGQIWDRLFDFNAGTSVWVYFSPTGWNTNTLMPGTHFAISSGIRLDPEMQLTQTVPVGTWHHVAVVLAKPNLTYYLDGVAQSTMTGMTLAPSDLGPTQDWLGRSAFPTDPYLSAEIDEFRLYSGALTPDQVAALASQ